MEVGWAEGVARITAEMSSIVFKFMIIGHWYLIISIFGQDQLVNVREITGYTDNFSLTSRLRKKKCLTRLTVKEKRLTFSHTVRN